VDASQALGSPQIAGLIVMGKGSGASAYRAVSIGNPVQATSIRQGQEAIRRRNQPPSDVVFDIHGGGFLALTAQDLALVEAADIPGWSPACPEGRLRSPSSTAVRLLQPPPS
jgi:hypothetical protein